MKTAFYLIHSMGAAGGFEDRDRRAAANFGASARAAGVRRVVYLGGLADERGRLWPRLRSHWYGIHPFHALIFGGMLRGIAAAAVALP